MRDTDWMAQASCHGDGTDWTAERQPAPAVVEHLAEVCAFCPVFTECAAYALEAKAEMGMYAGVWVPRHGVGARKVTKRWQEARERLAERTAPYPVTN